MHSRGSESGASRSEWVAPKLVELNIGMSDVAFGYDPGTDGDQPGFPDTSES